MQIRTALRNLACINAAKRCDAVSGLVSKMIGSDARIKRPGIVRYELG